MFAVPALVHLRLNTWALWREQRGQWERHQSLGREEARDWHWPGPGTCSGAVLAKPQAPSPGNILVSEATVHGLQEPFQPSHHAAESFMHLLVVVPFLLIGCHTHRCYRSFYEESVVRHRHGSRSRDGNAKPVKKQIKQSFDTI
uniref:Uncharacterized protein n=1 Tax=Rousettus aegyptiacus TaxID=9407 RepID=A0A7J8CHS4_ROUAE|nr:hypothetical protein HJG63_008975 [Rousettus aegyptiacus]